MTARLRTVAQREQRFLATGLGAATRDVEDLVRLHEHPDAHTQVMRNSGANDLGGTLMEETISRMAGSENGSAKSVAELVDIAAGIGRPTRQRTTTYESVSASAIAPVLLP